MRRSKGVHCGVATLPGDMPVVGRKREDPGKPLELCSGTNPGTGNPALHGSHCTILSQRQHMPARPTSKRVKAVFQGQLLDLLLL